MADEKNSGKYRPLYERMVKDGVYDEKTRRVKARVYDTKTGETTVEMVPIDEIEDPDAPRTRQEWRGSIADRMALNVAKTGHPFHHETADGTIVDADPTLEHMILQIGPGGEPPTPAFVASQVLPTVPINRKHYGFDPFAEDD